MKVLHVVTSSEGGAGLCASRIHKALVHIGVDSKMLFEQGQSGLKDLKVDVAEQDKDFWYSNPLTGKVKHLLNRMPWYWDKEKSDILLSKELSKLTLMPYVHHPFSNYKNIAHHPLVEWADIVHLHWVSGFVDYPSFFKKVRKPIVWTLHDMHPSRGLMHFYSPYSILPLELKDTEELFCKRKRRDVKKAAQLHTIAISESMKEEIEASPVLRGFPCTLIHNGVDTAIFKPSKKKAQSNSFLFSAYDIWENRKGLQRVIDALEKVELSQKELIVVGGNASRMRPQASFPVTVKGFVADPVELSRIYSEAGYYINASYEEAFAQTPLEAMACGTPVISTPCSGANDLIRPFNGVICNGYDIDALAMGIRQAMNTSFDSNVIRQYIIDNFEYSIIAEQYKSVYESILAE